MMMNELAYRTIGMTFDFIRQVVEDADLVASMTDGAEIEFIDKEAQASVKKDPRGQKIMRYKVNYVFEPVKE